MIRGQAVFDGLSVMEFTCDLTHETIHLEAKAAFIQTADVGEHKAGKTHGSTTCTHWSAATMKKLAEFREALEQDMARRHFKDVVGAAAGIDPEEVGGIGENLEDEEHRSL